MDRRKAIIGAATVAGSLLAASSAYALTGGIVASHGGDGAGQLNPVLDASPTGGSTTTGPLTAADASSNRADVSVDAKGLQAGDGSSNDEVERRNSDPQHKVDNPPEFEGRKDDD